ncbi:MAG: hypothetical protein Q4A76_06815 [Porphyromonadaceae bacterium]|nr:hypothetical protein [Porphyromonadaceae bacterium]
MKDKNFQELIKNSIDFGAGVFYYSKEKIEQFVDQMVERGEINKYQRDDIFQSLLKKGKEQKEEIERISKDTIKDYLSLNEYVKKADLDLYIEEAVKRQLKNLKED